MTTIAVVGLGYVGLPLAVEFGKKYRTLGFDLSAEKVAAYREFCDPTGEVASEDLRAATQLSCHTDPAVLAEADFVVVAVPTPVDAAHQPDFTPLVKSSETVGKHLKHGAVVVYESTVYPGATEEVCIPILERQSGMKWKEGFFVGYSPERINPGDKERTVTKILKVVSGDTPATLARVQEIYGSVITAGVYPASSIKVAEAAKVIENTQRDLNIALMNELAVIFHRSASTRSRCSRRRVPSGIFSLSALAWWVGTASGSIPTTSRTRPTCSAITPKSYSPVGASMTAWANTWPSRRSSR